MNIDNRFGLYTAFNLGLNKMMKTKERRRKYREKVVSTKMYHLKTCKSIKEYISSYFCR